MTESPIKMKISIKTELLYDDDSDSDGTPNYQDGDDDNDGNSYRK